METFTNIPAYKTVHHDTPKFASFQPLTEMEVHTVIMNLKDKHCELDIIPTSTLKKILDACLPAITQIVNLSLTRGEFCEEWTAIVKPLLKKPGLDLINKNYRPISNWLFISKLVENWMLKQILSHCENHDILDACLPAITQIVNLSLTRGEFCEEWKTAIVKPLLKKPGLDLINKNYRPISNWLFISKLVENWMLKQILSHCENHDILPDFHSAYHEHYSTETSLIRLSNDILWLMERQQVTAMAILDLSAFDTLDHEILLQVGPA